MLELVRTMRSIVGELVPVKGHPLTLVRRTEWTNAWEERLLAEAAALNVTVAKMQEAALAVGAVLGIKLETASGVLFDAIDGLIDVLLQAPQICLGVVASAGDAPIRGRLEMVRRHGEQRNVHWNELSDRFRPDIVSVDGEQCTVAWTAACMAWWPKRWFAQRAITGQLASFSHAAQRPPVPEVIAILSSLRAINEQDQALKASHDFATEMLGAEYQAAATDWAALRRYEHWSQSFEEAIGKFGTGKNLDAITAFTQRLRKLAIHQRATLLPGGPLSSRFVTFRDNWRQMREQLTLVAGTSDAGGLLSGDLRAAGLTSRIRSTTAGWVASRRWLRVWCRWRQLREQALGLGLEAIIEKTETEQIAVADLEAYTDYSYQTWWLKAVVDREPILRNFSSVDHDRKIRDSVTPTNASRSSPSDTSLRYLAAKFLARWRAGNRILSCRWSCVNSPSSELTCPYGSWCKAFRISFISSSRVC
jgi:hypothetical protein